MKKETYPEYVKRKDAKRKDVAKRKAGKALAKKNINVPPKDKKRG